LKAARLGSHGYGYRFVIARTFLETMQGNTSVESQGTPSASRYWFPIERVNDSQ